MCACVCVYVRINYDQGLTKNNHLDDIKGDNTIRFSFLLHSPPSITSKFKEEK